MWEQLLRARPGGLSSGNKLAVARLGNAQGVYCPLLEHSAYCLVFSQNKVAENRLFQFIYTEMGWICISSQNNHEI